MKKFKNNYSLREKLGHIGNFAILLVAYVLLSTCSQAISYYFGYKRFFFGIELFLAFIFASQGFLRFAWITFVLSLAIEVAHLTASVFYLYNLSQVWDMVEFFLEAKARYILMAVAFAVLLFGVFYLVVKIPKKNNNKSNIIFFLAVFALLFQFQWHIAFKNQTFFTPTFADREHLLFGSIFHILDESMNINKHISLGAGADEDADYYPIQQPSAVDIAWSGNPKAERILLIVAEAWGLPKNAPEVLQSQLKSLLQSEKLEAVEIGQVFARGATATGELRELCGVVPTQLNFRKMTPEAIGECLPAHLRKRGYSTFGIHAAHGSMYRRTIWWPKVGLHEILFKETINLDSKLCNSFPGYCDRDLIPIVLDKIQKKKSFVYWMTLNSHMPYSNDDIIEFRPELCEVKVEIMRNDKLCAYQNLHVQFFEGIAQLVSDEKLKGVQVLIVGDHPPLFNDEMSRNLFSRDSVPFLSFMVKE